MAPGPVPEASPGLGIEFPVKNAGFGCVSVELCHFLSFLKALESCEPLFDDLGFLFFDFETWEGFSVWIGRGSLPWIWIGRVSFVKKLNFQAVIKSAASAASPKTKIQESRGASGRRLSWRATGTARLPWIPGFWSSGRLR